MQKNQNPHCTAHTTAFQESCRATAKRPTPSTAIVEKSSASTTKFNHGKHLHLSFTPCKTISDAMMQKITKINSNSGSGSAIATPAMTEKSKVRGGQSSYLNKKEQNYWRQTALSPSNKMLEESKDGARKTRLQNQRQNANSQLEYTFTLKMILRWTGIPPTEVEWSRE